MKYLITESQIDRVIFKYLDNQDFIQIDTNNNIYFVNSEDDKQSIIRYFKKGGRCVIYTGLIDEVASFFSLEGYDAREAIGRWVGRTANVDVGYCVWVQNKDSAWLTIPSN